MPSVPSGHKSPMSSIKASISACTLREQAGNRLPKLHLKDRGRSLAALILLLCSLQVAMSVPQFASRAEQGQHHAPNYAEGLPALIDLNKLFIL